MARLDSNVELFRRCFSEDNRVELEFKLYVNGVFVTPGSVQVSDRVGHYRNEDAALVALWDMCNETKRFDHVKNYFFEGFLQMRESNLTEDSRVNNRISRFENPLFNP